MYAALAGLFVQLEQKPALVPPQSLRYWSDPQSRRHSSHRYALCVPEQVPARNRSGGQLLLSHAWQVYPSVMSEQVPRR